jgi:hypothetical protein
MAKILRAIQKVFGDNVVATDNIAQFGSLKAGSPLFSKDPSIIQSLNAYLEGWKSAVVNNNAPALQDENALNYLWSRQLAYLFQQGIAEWEVGTEYHEHSLVTSGGVIYRSIQNTNVNHAVSDAAWWKALFLDITALGASGDTTMKTLFGYGRLVSPTQTASAAGSETIDCSLKHVGLKTGGTATITLSNLAEGQSFTLVVTSTGSAYTITWSPTIKWPSALVPVPTTVSASRDVYTFTKIGGEIFGTVVKDMR